MQCSGGYGAGATLTVDDLRPGRIRMVEPAPVPEDELHRTYEWMRSWDMLDNVGAETLVDLERQKQAHVAAE